MLPQETGKFMLDTLVASVSYSKKALWGLFKETLRLIRQPICTPQLVIRVIPLWEFSETLSEEAIILSTRHTTEAGVRTWSLEAVQLNWALTLDRTCGLARSGPDTTKAVILKSCQKQLAAQCPGCWCCINDAQWTAWISREGESQTALAKSLDWSRECSQLSHSAGRLLGYVRFCVSCKPHTAWPGWLEWVRIKVLMWPSHKPYGDRFLVFWVHCPPFSALLWTPGGWPVRTFINWLLCPLASGWMVQGEPEQEICGGKWVRGKVFPWLFSCRLAGALLGAPPTQTSLTLVPRATLSSHPFWPTYRSDGIPTLSPALGCCNLPCSLPVPCS